MMPLNLFLEIVKLFQDKIAVLEHEKADALKNDAADKETIAVAEKRAIAATEEAKQIKDAFSAYQSQDDDEDTQLTDAMLAIKNELESGVGQPV